MSKKLTWYGHNCFSFEYGKTVFILDPFLVEGISPISSQDLRADYLLVSHGHSDHCFNVLEIARHTNAKIIANAEIANFFSQKGLSTESMNIGGAIYVQVSSDPTIPLAQILAVQAPHSSTTPDGSSGGNSLGFLISFSQNGNPISPNQAPIRPMAQTLACSSAFTIYFACDTGYFSEMEWLGKLGIDLAILPIGDRYTMGPSMSIDAILALKPKYVIPSHYNTWPTITQNTDHWSNAVQRYTQAKAIVLSLGQRIQEVEDETWQ